MENLRVLHINGPIGIGAEHRVLRTDCRNVLVLVPFVVAGTQLMDFLLLLESDQRIQVVFSVPPAANGALCHGAEEFIRSRGGLVLPWHQAIQHEFDLVLAASPEGTDQVHGKILMLPHGAGWVGPRPVPRSAGPDGLPTHGLLAREFLTRRGRLLPRALALTHDSELAVLSESCREAMPIAVVAGDICYDRLAESLPQREYYRRALGVHGEQKLVTVSSSWQPESSLGSNPDLLDRLLTEMNRDEYRVAAILHPNTWNVHSAYQVRTWFADYLEAGLLLLPPEEGWHATVVASDLIIGDYGSVTRYGAAIGVPVMVTPVPEGCLRPGSSADRLYRHAPHLRPDAQLEAQIRAASAVRGQAWQDALAEQLTSRPGEAGIILRRTMYDLLGLSEPDRKIQIPDVPKPKPITTSA